MSPEPKILWCGTDLEALEKKVQIIRDHVTAIAKGYKFGLFLYGFGGAGKSYTVLQQLAKLEAAYRLSNTRMTAKGLFLQLKAFPDATHVLEDMERLTKDPDAQGVLRSALWSQPGHPRLVTWTTATNGSEQFEFRGGLILISNRPLSDMPELQALATRIEVHRLDVTDAEIAALMRYLASQGHYHGEHQVICPESCLEVTEYLIEESQKAGCRLDLRLQQKAFQTFRQWEADWSTCHWKDLVAASVREATHHFLHAVDTTPREEKRVRRRAILRAIIAQTDDVKKQEELYTQQTGFKRADYFRRKAEIQSGEFDPEV